MQLVTLQTLEGHHPGVVVGKEILDFVRCAEALPEAHLLPRSLRSILAAGEAGLDLVRRLLDRVQRAGTLTERLREIKALVNMEQAILAAPIPDPSLLLSCGTNYGGHMREMGAKLPSAPGSFIKFNGAIIGTGAAIVLPRSNPEWVDYEGEFSFVIGRPCHQVSEQEAMDYVAGYTLVNDVSARDWVLDMMSSAKAGDLVEINRAVLYNITGKNFPTFSPMGPTIATKDEIPDPHAITFKTFLNAQEVQLGRTDDFIFSIPWIIAEFSKFYAFQPGDVVTTGSPAGVGFGRKPQRLLRAGDRVDVQNDKIGTLSNPVIRG